MFVAVGLVLLIFILPALAISWVVPAQQLSLTAGVMQAFAPSSRYFGIARLVPSSRSRSSARRSAGC